MAGDHWGNFELFMLDIKKALAELVNLPPLFPRSAEAMDKARQFISRYGKLRRPPRAEPLEEKDYIVDVLHLGQVFRHAWNTSDVAHINAALDGIFSPSVWAVWEGPAIRADFATGQWEPVPRNRLDELAIQLMRSRRMLTRCENPACQKYMVKEFSHDKYCSNRCSDIMRATKVAAWRASQKLEKKRRKK